MRTNDSVFIMVLLGLLGLALGAVIGYKWFKSIFALVYALLGRLMGKTKIDSDT
ncbi:MAG: hypothetical protein RSD27_10275 [Ruthenibacterium sp.]